MSQIFSHSYNYLIKTSKEPKGHQDVERGLRRLVKLTKRSVKKNWDCLGFFYPKIALYYPKVSTNGSKTPGQNF